MPFGHVSETSVPTRINIGFNLSDIVQVAFWGLVGIVVVFSLAHLHFLEGPSALGDKLSAFATIFLGIFIKAAPFLLLGTLASGLVEVFVDRRVLVKLLPKNALVGAIAGSMMGLLFPVCECGVVPLTRRFLTKGVRLPLAVSFMLASPVVNPIVMASAISAFDFGPITLWRFGLSGAIALTIGLIFSLEKAPYRLTQAIPIVQGGSEDRVIDDAQRPSRAAQIQHALAIAGGEFFEMGRFLVLGSTLAALMQTVVPQSALIALSSGPLLPVLVMMALAVLLSICSTVDSFVALAFAGTFSGGSLLAFLVFGPMVDIKSTLLYLQVFNRRTVFYLLLLTFMLCLTSALFVNLFLPWS